jgi:hypothetical protein
MKKHSHFLPLVLLILVILFITHGTSKATIGFGSPWVYLNSYHTVLPPVALSFDYGFRDDIGPGILSIGGMLGATTYRDRASSFTYGYKSTTAIIALRGTYHYQFIDQLDTYAGVHLGLRFESWKEYGIIVLVEPRDFNVRPVFNLFAGAKYYVTDQIALMLELGYSIAFINAGVCIRL